MYKETIGENAGKIWKLLSDSGQLSVSGIKKAADMKDKDLYMGLGWLAREEKVKFDMKRNQLLVELAEE